MRKRFPLSTRRAYELMVAEGYDLSKDTSRPQVPELFGVISDLGLWHRGTVNLDLGGGRYDKGTKYLSRRGVTNLILDPGNRPADYTLWVLDEIEAHGCDTVTCCNLLNVLPLPEDRAAVVRTAWDALPDGAPAYFSVYAGGKRGWRVKNGKRSWQEGRKLVTYMPEISPPFTVPLDKPYRDIIMAIKL